jgi:hypothetical protein
MIIKFTDIFGVSESFSPVPASKALPDWYKKLDSYENDEKKPVGNGGTSASAKRCMPIFDSITSGYIIFTHCDIWVSQREDEETGSIVPYYEWAFTGAIDFHPKKQLPEHPLDTGHKKAYPKLISPWSIETPPGYSSLFISPMHRETPIIALPGVVDTDKYTAPVNFPFVLRDPGMTGLIPAGTPIVQVIPFKRDKWTMKFGGREDIEKNVKTITKLRSLFFDSYKRQFRQSKEYR